MLHIITPHKAPYSLRTAKGTHNSDNRQYIVYLRCWLCTRLKWKWVAFVILSTMILCVYVSILTVERTASHFSDYEWKYPCAGEATQARTSLYMVTYYIEFPSCHCPTNDVFLTMVFQALWVLTTMPNGNTDVLAWLFYSTQSVHRNRGEALWQLYLNSACDLQVWWPKWRCRGPSLSDATTCITSASTTALRRGTRTSLSTCPLASGTTLLTCF